MRFVISWLHGSWVSFVDDMSCGNIRSPGRWWGEGAIKVLVMQTYNQSLVPEGGRRDLTPKLIFWLHMQGHNLLLSTLHSHTRIINGKKIKTLKWKKITKDCACLLRKIDSRAQKWSFTEWSVYIKLGWKIPTKNSLRIVTELCPFRSLILTSHWVLTVFVFA